MTYADPAVRAAYRLGASDCYQSSIPHLDARIERELIDWLSGLYEWEGGDPPEPPHSWRNITPIT